MTIAMMLPSSVPLLILFHLMVRERATAAWLITVVVAGYLLIWTLCGVFLESGVWIARSAIASLAWPTGTPSLTGAALLAVAGAY